jgi:hypothetical protein
MRNNKDKWSVIKLPNRPTLSANDAKYWKTALFRNLKVGMEFEFNLPKKENGSCHGDSTTCPCAKLLPKNECWQQCINTAACANTPRSIETCTNVTGTCEADACKTCEHYQVKCEGPICPNFISFCYTCEEYATECKPCRFRFDPRRSPKAIREDLNRQLAPVNSYGVVAPSGVHSITTDGSLKGEKGAEIITVGRRVDYWEFFKMAQNIINLSVEKGAYLNERCSIHMHLLASYYSKVLPNGMGEKMGVPDKVNEMERDLPEIVLANFHQLVRRYQNAMTWMTMGLEEQERLTRWEKFRVSVLPYSAIMNTMNEVCQQVAANAGGTGGGKYGWANYCQVGFAKGGDINRLHVEMRAADGLLSPSAVAAIGCMYYALMIKAVQVSEYGIVEIGDDDWMEQAERVKQAMLNGTGDYKGSRFGDTSNLHKYYDVLIGESLDLVQQLKPILIKIGPAYEVLEKLAERPCALRRADGHTWERIEDDLKVIVNEVGRIEIALGEIITLNQVVECKDFAEWIDAVGKVLRTDPEVGIDPDNDILEDEISQFVERKRNDGELVWSEPIGAPIMI